VTRLDLQDPRQDPNRLRIGTLLQQAIGMSQLRVQVIQSVFHPLWRTGLGHFSAIIMNGYGAYAA
jgi:hypothetical protein